MSMPDQMPKARMTVSLVVKRACRRSISTPPMIATAVWVGPTSHRPFRLVPAMIATEVS